MSKKFLKMIFLLSINIANSHPMQLTEIKDGKFILICGKKQEEYEKNKLIDKKIFELLELIDYYDHDFSDSITSPLINVWMDFLKNKFCCNSVNNLYKFIIEYIKEIYIKMDDFYYNNQTLKQLIEIIIVLGGDLEKKKLYEKFGLKEIKNEYSQEVKGKLEVLKESINNLKEIARIVKGIKFFVEKAKKEEEEISTIIEKILLQNIENKKEIQALVSRINSEEGFVMFKNLEEKYSKTEEMSFRIIEENRMKIDILIFKIIEIFNLTKELIIKDELEKIYNLIKEIRKIDTIKNMQIGFVNRRSKSKLKYIQDLFKYLKNAMDNIVLLKSIIENMDLSLYY